jgi:hypothetical protein
MPRTALIVPVPEAAGTYDPGNGVPPHVTILFPFADAGVVDEDAVRELVSRFPAFDFVLDRIEQFEEGTRWLHPEPSAPFVDLTEAVVERWPDHPPYEGAFDEPIPHLTITVEDVSLPIACRAREVQLIEESEADGRWSVRASFPLYGVA